MPPITVPILNDIPAFQTIIQGENVSETKRVLIETVTQMSLRRWNCRCFASTYRRKKQEAESDLLVALSNSSSMDEVKQVLYNYKQQLNNIQHQIRPQGNTNAFMRGIGPLVDRSYSLEKAGKVDEKSIKLISGISGRPEYLSNIPESICIDIIKAMKKTGYHPNEKGMCYGIAWTALLACVRQGGRMYMERMQYLKKMDTPPLSGTNDTYQVYPFFDTVTLSMANYKDMSGYEKGIGYPGRQEVAFPGRIVGGHEPGYQVPVVTYTFIAECTHKTFIQFLRKTRKNNKGIPFGLMINYSCHATGIGFDGSKWLAVDHDRHYYTEATDMLYTFFREQSNYHEDGRIIAVIEVVTSNEHSLTINNDTLVVNAKKSVSISLVLRLALRYGDVNATIGCITVIGQQVHTLEILLELLNCKDSEGTPGFCIAMENGHSDVVTAFIETSTVAIARLSLSNTEKAKWLCKLLFSETADGTPAFCLPLQNGCPDTITAFIKGSAAAIAKFSLPEGLKATLLYKLLVSKAVNNTPGFLLTLQNGHTDAVTAFIKESTAEITALHLSEERKAELVYRLLISKRTYDVTGLFMALQNDHVDTVATFIKASAAVINAFLLPEEQKAKLVYKLLVCKTVDGTPGFFMALQNGYSDAITTFVQASAAAFDALSLPEKQKAKLLCELLASKKANDIPGFYMALRNGHSNAIRAFIKAGVAAIAKLLLPEEEKAKLLYELLASKKTNGTPGFFIALRKGHTEAITAFIQASAEAIHRLSLSKSEKAEWLCKLLASKGSNGMSGFFVTLYYDHLDTVTAFIQAIAVAMAALSNSEEEIAERLYRFFHSMKIDHKENFLLALKHVGPAVGKAFAESVDQLPLSVR